MLKKFLNDESKATIIDFLFWLLVYPFVIAFAVACVAFIFSFSSFNDVKITDWISSLSTLFGIVIAVVGFNSWRTQKHFDLEIKYLETLKTIQQKCLSLRSDLRLTRIELHEICDRHINQMLSLHVELEVNTLIVQKNKDEDLNDLLKKHELLYRKLVDVIAYSHLSKSIDQISSDKQDIENRIQAVHDKVDNLINNFKFS